MRATSSGDVSVTTTSNLNLVESIAATNGSITLSADDLLMPGASTISAGTNQVTIRATGTRPIDLGTDHTPGTLSLSDEQIDRITAGTLQLGKTSGGAITVTAPLSLAFDNVSILCGSALLVQGSITTTGNLTLQGDDLTMTGASTINAGTNRVSIIPTAGRPVDLGTDGVPSAMSLSDEQLDRITAGVLDIGSSSAGALTISNVISFAFGTVPTLHLRSGSGVSQNGAGLISVSNLAVNAGSNVNLLTNANSVTNVAIAATSGNAQFRDQDSVNVTSLDGVSGIITSGGGASVQLPGTMNLLVANALSASSGTIELLGGTFAVQAAAAGNAIANTGTLSFSGGATLNLNNQNETLGSLSGSGAIQMGSGHLTLAAAVGNAFSGSITGTGNLIMNGSGGQTLSGAGFTYSGTTHIVDGQLELAGGASPGDGTNKTIVTGGTLKVSHTTPITEQLDLQGNGSTVAALTGQAGATVAGNITLTGNATIGAREGTAGTFTISGNISDGGNGYGITFKDDFSAAHQIRLSGTNTFTGPLNVDANVKLEVAGGDAVAEAARVSLNGIGSTLTLLTTERIGSLSGGAGSAVSASGILITGGDGTSSTFAGEISGDSLMKVGNGVFTISGNNSYIGSTTVNEGTLRVEHANALGLGGVHTVVNPNGTLELNAAVTYNEVIGLNGGKLKSGTAATLTGGIILSFNSFIETGFSAPLTIDSAITGPGGVTLDGNVGGGLWLQQANSFQGAVIVNAGTFLRLAHAGALGSTAAATQLNPGGTIHIAGVAIAGEALTMTNAGVTGAGAAAWNGTIDLTGANSFSPQGGTLTLGGAITGSGGLNLNGPGTLVLAGANSYAGTTSVPNGALRVDGSITSAVAVQGSGSLQGNGTTGAVITSGNAIVAPGASAGILSTGSVNLASGTHLQFELNGVTVGSGYDQLNVTGTVTLGNATLDVTRGFLPANGASFVIIQNDNGDAINGTFNGLAEGAVIDVAGKNFTISYAGGDGNDVVLTATPNTRTWDGGGADNKWTTAANWVGDVAPSAGDSLVFAGSTQPNTFNDFAAGTTFGSLSFTGTANFTLLGNAVTLSAGGLAINSTAGTNSIHLDVAFTQASTISDTGDGLRLFGTIDNGGHLLMVSGPSGSEVAIHNVISGTGGLTVTGGRLVRLRAANTYSGLTSINQGGIIVDLAGQLGDASSGTIVAAGAGLALHVTSSAEHLTLGADLVMSGNLLHTGDIVLIGSGLSLISYDNATLAGNISDAGAGHSVIFSTLPAGVLNLTGTNTYGGATHLSGAEVRLGGGSALPDASAVTIAPATLLNLNGSNETIGSLAGDGIVLLGSGTLTTGGNGASTTQSGPITGAGGLVKQGGGVFTLSGNNSYAGMTLIDHGILRANHGSALGTTAGGTTVNNGAALELNASTTFGDMITLNGGKLESGAHMFANLSGGVHLGADSFIATGFNAPLTIDSAITGPGGFTLDGNGGVGGLWLQQANSFQGEVHVNTFLRLANTGALGSTAAGTHLNSGGSLRLGGVAISSEVLTMNNASIVGFDDAAWNGAIALTGANDFAPQGGTLTLGGSITGTGSLTMNSTGTLILAGVNSYAGPTQVSNGTLLANGSLTSNVNLSGNGVLGGNGLTGAVTAVGNATVSPGASTAALHTGNLSLAAGTHFAVEINGTDPITEHDLVDVNGTITLGNATLDATLGYVPGPIDTIRIIQNDGVDAVAGTFNGLAEQAEITLGGQAFLITYVGGDGNDVELFRNRAPVVASEIPDQLADEDAPFFLDVSENFGDPDAGNTLTYSVLGLSSWLAFADGIFSGTPSNDDLGTVSITVTAEDDFGKSVSDTFALTVLNVNDAPTVVAPIDDQLVDEDTPFTLDVTGNFADEDLGDSLTFTADELPGWLTFEDGVFGGTLNAGGGDDLLIVGTTAYAPDRAVWNNVLAEWNSAQPFSTRVSNLSSLLNDTTAFDDGDVLTGGAGSDWLLLSRDPDNAILDQAFSAEAQTDID